MRICGDKLVNVVHGTLRETAFILQAKIAEDTPIDTGRARGSWRLNENQPDTSQLPLLRDNVNPISGAIIEKAAPGAKELSPGEALQTAVAQQSKIGPTPKVIFVSNTVPYIEALENGYSKQAPQGMAGVNLNPAQVQSKVSEIARLLSS